jgi:hypothetical protein
MSPTDWHHCSQDLGLASGRIVGKNMLVPMNFQGSMIISKSQENLDDTIRRPAAYRLSFHKGLLTRKHGVLSTVVEANVHITMWECIRKVQLTTGVGENHSTTELVLHASIGQPVYPLSLNHSDLPKCSLNSYGFVPVPTQCRP